MMLVVLLGLGWLCAPLGALAMDFSVKNSADEQGAQEDSWCVSDEDCGAGKFCVRLWNEKPFCATCRRTRRRCQHVNMCCPGMLCVNNVCTLREDIRPKVERGTKAHTVQQDKHTRKPSIGTPPPEKARKGQKCLTSLDCRPGLCCAHHFWNKVCKPQRQEGKVCSGRDYNFGPVLAQFQRCKCKAGLVCRSQVAHRHCGQLQVCQKP
ncbi:dickkopf-related protein 4-like [Budorcas taxicolor]|uniref:dickkopf-related protein 4-like n=1 Tax=Budorcas taxicolor TaxID=37181 RepID=UPI002284E002|nr:dickkopf-related protein 4-like [Budorcas taxicolor]